MTHQQREYWRRVGAKARPGSPLEYLQTMVAAAASLIAFWVERPTKCLQDQASAKSAVAAESDVWQQKAEGRRKSEAIANALLAARAVAM